MTWDDVHITRNTYFMRITNKQGWYDKIPIHKDLYEKISRWDDLCIGDFEKLMEESKKDNEDKKFKIINNDLEADFIKNLRKHKININVANRSFGLLVDIDEHNIDPEDVRKLLRSHYCWK
jgi:hypothetical protein